MKRNGLVAAGVIVLLAVVYLLFFSGGEADALNARMDEIEETLSMNPKPGNIALAAKAKQTSTFFDLNPTVESLPGYPTLRERSAITQYALSAFSMLDTIDFRLVSRAIRLNESEDRASVEVTAKVDGRRGGETENYQDRFIMEWAKLDGEWKILSVSRSR